jgi:ribonucleoside-diphosphate reductase beta chain
MEITQIRKRDGSIVGFKSEKIAHAVLKAFAETNEGGEEESKRVAARVHERIVAMCVQSVSGLGDSADTQNIKCLDGYPAVEEIQDLVEATLMEMDFFETAKAYILYRAERKRLRERDVFSKRAHLKPYEYPELYEYATAVRHSYWVHTEFNYTRDIDDFKTRVNEAERESIKRTMLAIAQIEVAVKTFWGNLYSKLPKPEIGAVGFTFAESEVRHMDAYAHLLEILGLNDEFKKLAEVPVIKKRVEYLEKVIAFSKTSELREYSQAVLLFSLFIEHVSLFSQFLIMMSFNKHRNLFKGISNAVEATSKEEQIHGMFGIELINIIKKEHPEWFDHSHRETVRTMCIEAYQAESAIVDWIFEKGDLDFLPREQVKEFIKQRLNNSLKSIGMSAVFSVDEAILEKTEWFNDEVIATKHVDFFDKRSINYNKRQKSITAHDLF